MQPRRLFDTEEEDQEMHPVTDKSDQKELEELRVMLGMVTTLLLRHEVQLNINRLDTGFMIFLQTTTPNSIAHTTFQIGNRWKDAKQNDPSSLSQPMRVVIFQHLLTVVKERFKAMLHSPSSRSKASDLGWISSSGKEVYGLRWNPANKQHEKDHMLPTLTPEEIETALTELIALAAKPLVIHRYHATRQLAEQYASPTLAMMLEVGNRADDAQAAWRHLHRLSQSAVWAAAGCYMRHERLKMGALAQKLARLMK